MRKIITLLTLLFVCVMFLIACTSPNNNSKEVYTVATGSNFPPFEFINEKTGELEGFDIDLMKAIATEANFEIKFEIISWDGFIAAMQKNRFDIGIDGVTITNDRKKMVDFSEPYYQAGIIIAVRVENQDIKTEKDLHGKKIGIVTQTTSEKLVRESFPETEIFSYPSSPELFMDLRAGRIDAIFNDLPRVKYYIAKSETKELKTVGPVLQSQDYGIVFPKDSPLLASVNRALKALIEKGIYDDIYEKWFNERPYGT